MNLFIPIAVCSLISLVFLWTLVKFCVTEGRMKWKYIWLVIGIAAPWFYFLTDSIHLTLPGGSSLDVHFRQVIQGQLQKSGFWRPSGPLHENSAMGPHSRNTVIKEVKSK